MTLKKAKLGPDENENQAIKESSFKFAVFIRSTPRPFPPKFIENTFLSYPEYFYISRNAF